MASSMTDWPPAGTMLRCKTRCCAGSGGRKVWDTKRSPPPLRCSRAWRWNIQRSKNGKHKQKTCVSIRKHFLKSKLLDISIAKSSFLSCIFVKNFQLDPIGAYLWLRWLQNYPPGFRIWYTGDIAKRVAKFVLSNHFPCRHLQNHLNHLIIRPTSVQPVILKVWLRKKNKSSSMPRVLPSYLKHGSFWRYGFLLKITLLCEIFCAIDGLQ